MVGGASAHHVHCRIQRARVHDRGRTERLELLHHRSLLRALALGVAVIADIDDLLHVDRLRRDQQTQHTLSHKFGCLVVGTNQNVDRLLGAVRQHVLQPQCRIQKLMRTPC